MDKELRKEARKQYLRYFRIWFIVVGLLLAVTAGAGIVHAVTDRAERTNNTAPTERVYDEADILTDEEEEKLRQYIAKKEAEYQVDFVIRTISQPVEGAEAMEEYDYRSENWEQNMRDLADDFWDENGYGFNKAFEGDGSILIDNRYTGQRGEWLSTSGRVEQALGYYAVENVLDAVDKYYDKNPYKAYIAYIDAVCGYLEDGIQLGGTYYLGALILSVIVTAVYASCHLGKNKARDTVAVNAYVAGGKPVLRSQGDDFIRKNVVKRHIETQSSGGGGSHRSGGGGHHTSRSGASHGGGGRRH